MSTNAKSDVMRFWGKPLLPFAAALIVTATGFAATPAAARTLCVGGETLLLRAGPSPRHNPVGSLPARACGIQVVGECAAGWCEVALGNRRGWVDSRRVTIQDGAKSPAKSPAKPPVTGAVRPPPQSPSSARAPGSAPSPAADGHCVMGVARGDTLRIRSGPSAEHRELGGIPPGSCDVHVVGACSGSWCPVTYRGLRGWSNASYLRPPWMR